VHFDTQDTFIVQLEGSKEWEVWPSPFVPLPDDDMVFQITEEDVEALGEPEATITLNEGARAMRRDSVLGSLVTKVRES
jgi:ribosomal protein L16 Arg81 hydroxylase